jgi:hypothetical protein
MIFGTVAYELKNGKKAEVPWGARAVMKRVADEWKMEFYQVYLVRSQLHHTNKLIVNRIVWLCRMQSRFTMYIPSIF